MTDRPGWLRRLWARMVRHRRSLVLALVAAVGGGLCQVAVPLVARQIVDTVIVAHTAPLAPWLLLLLALAAVAFGCAYLRRYHGGRVALGVQNDLRNAMHDHLQRMDQATLARMSTGQVVGRANSDSALVQGFLNMLPVVSGNLLLLVLSLAVMLVLSPPLALVTLAITPVLLLLSIRMRTRVFPATWDAQQREGEIAQIVDEDVNGVRVVKAFGREAREVERIAAASRTLYGAQLRAVRLQARYQPLLQAVPAFGQVAVLALGGWLALRHQLTIGTFLAFSSYLAAMLAPARQLAGILAIGQQARAGVERIEQLLDQVPAIVDAPDAVDAQDGGDLRFEQVRVEHDGAAVLDGLDLTIRAGERVAVVGPSGSGKSTLAGLVLRFADPVGGRVLLGGADLRGLRLSSLRSRVGMVFEESFLFSDTVAANIAYGRPDATPAEIEAAARIAQAHGFITALPAGYDTPVGERGLTLSGGQRQRIALARALLLDPRILVLDDATSAVDAGTEEAIHDGLRAAFGDRTVLLVAHRESTLRLADRVLLLDGGRIADEGAHEELLERNPLYRALLTGEDDEGAAAGLVDALVLRAGSGALRAEGAAAPLRATGGPGLGMGLGGGGGRGMGAVFAPTPELLARVAALPPIRDEARIDVAHEARQDRDFSLRRLLVEFRRPLAVALLLVVLDAVAGLLGPVLVKTGVDGGVQAGSAAVLFGASGLFLAVVTADLLDSIAETLVTGRLAQRVMLSLRIRIWAHLQRLSIDFFEREMAGRIMTRMTTDVDQFESLVQTGLLSALVAAVTFVGVGVALLVVDARLGAVTLAVVVPLAVATVLFRRRAAVLYDEARERIAIVNADFQESLSGVRESQAFVHEARTSAHFAALGARYLASRVAAQRLVALYFPFVQLLSGVADAVVLGVGAALVGSGQLTTGVLIAFLLYVDLFFSPVQQLSQVFDAWQQTRVSVGRIGELMRIETRTPQVPDAVVPGRLSGAIELIGVHFAYPAARPRPGAGLRGPSDPRLPVATVAPAKPPEALQGVDLAVRAGETLALVGETGAGKSTVMRLIARFADPDEGVVRVDGLDLRDLDLAAYRRQLGYVPQEAFLFTGTVRDAIAYGRPEATDDEVVAAARAVGAHDLIAALPGGYAHELGERGRSLSAGHRQLLALARAELVDPAVLLLDEATSNLDLATEARVAAAMQAVARGRTTVVIAHRLQTARAADRIAVLSGGRIVEVGDHEALLAADGRYAAMWRAFAATEPSPASPR